MASSDDKIIRGVGMLFGCVIGVIAVIIFIAVTIWKVWHG